MTSPTLSVVLSNYNHAQFIPDALEAILVQSYRPIEILIIDDASIDDSVQVLNRYATREPTLIKVIRNETNLGLLHNAQRLLEISSGDFVYFAASDDKILPGFFERSLNLLSLHSAAGLCSTLSRIMNEGGQDQGVVQMPLVRRAEGYLSRDEALLALRKHRSWFMGNTTIFRRAALLDLGGFPAELGPYSDCFVSLVIALQHGACFIPEPLAAWRRMPGTYSNRVSSEMELMIEILDRAEELMRSTYRDLFPEDVIAEWKRAMYFSVSSSYIASVDDGGFIGLERLMPRRSAVDALFVSILRNWPAFGQMVAKPYLFARLMRGHAWSTLSRKIAYWFDPRLRRLPQ
jgi:glycosyltransferase involved in cell wall biosynthesis